MLILLLFFSLSTVVAGAQNLRDSVLSNPSFVSINDFSKGINRGIVEYSSGIILELAKINSNKKYWIVENEDVYDWCIRQKSKAIIIRAYRFEITECYKPFRPYGKRFDQLTDADLSRAYYEFATLGSTVKGTLVNSLILSVNVAVTVLIVFVAIFNQQSWHVGDMKWIPFVDFNKHIHFFNERGKKKWEGQIIELAL